MREGESYAGRVEEGAAFLRSRLGPAPRSALVLGSGLSPSKEELPHSPALDFKEIPYFPHSLNRGHPGRLALGRLGKEEVLLQMGRVHLYEGFSAASVVFPQVVLAEWGVEQFVLTNAAGGIHPKLAPGDLMLLRDHLNLTGTNPLAGNWLDSADPTFPDMTEAYSFHLRTVARKEAGRKGLSLREGVYAGVVGPSYETPAEVRMLRRAGADAVGMSTVLEVIALNGLGRSPLAISLIANRAAGTDSLRLTHQEVLRCSREGRGRLFALLEGFFGRVAEGGKEKDGNHR